MTLIMTQLKRLRNFQPGNICLPRLTGGRRPRVTPVVRCQAGHGQRRTSHFCLGYPRKPALWQMWTSVLDCGCPVFFSLICQDNHFPILLNKHRLPCLNTVTVLTEHTAFNHSVLSTLARVWERNQNIFSVNWLILLLCKSQETGERNLKLQIKGEEPRRRSESEFLNDNWIRNAILNPLQLLKKKRNRNQGQALVFLLQKASSSANISSWLQLFCIHL